MSQPVGFGLIVAALVLEWLAVPADRKGGLSLAFPCYLLLAVEFGPGWLAIGLVAGLLPRSLRGDRIERRASLCDGLAALLAGALAGLAGDLALAAAGTVFLVARLALAQVLTGSFEAAAFPVQAVVLLVTILAAHLDSWAWLCLAAVVALGHPIGYALLGQPEVEQQLAAREVRHAREEGQVRAELGQTREELQDRLQEHRVLRDLAHAFAAGPDLEATLELAFAALEPLVPHRSMVYFDASEGHLQARVWRSPDQERLASQRLLGLSEPIVERAWSSQRLVLSKPSEAKADRLLPAEDVSVGIPLAGLGVLYIGKSAGPAFSRRQLQLATLVAEPLIPALWAARRRTELQQALERLTLAYEELQRSQDQLVQASKMAAVGQLAAGVAHEINSPLGAVVIGLEMARRGLKDHPDAGVLEDLEVALEAANAARAIIEGLLVYSRTSKGEIESVEFEQVVRQTLQLVGGQLTVPPTIVIEPHPPFRANLRQLCQVLTNLLLNARDAVKAHPEPRLEIRAGAGYLEVRDNGPGVAAEDVDHLFEPFFTTKPPGEGTGLGLAVSAQLVEGMGGQLSYHREEGWTCFRVTFGTCRPGPGC